MEIFSTIITGVIVYVLGQFALKIIIEPIQDLKKEIQQTLADCSFYWGIVTNMPDVKEELIKEASITFRKRSTSLRSKVAIIPFLDFFADFKILPTRHNLSEASSRLMGISNLAVTKGNREDNMTNFKWLQEAESFLNPKVN